MKKKIDYKEGDWFAVPLKNGYAVGNIARMSKKGKVLFGYFFGPIRKEIPSLQEIKDLKADHALEKYRFGDLYLYNGDWPIIGSPEKWKRDEWPIPGFYRKDFLQENHYRRVVYSDTDPNHEILEESVPFKMVKDLPKDSLMGADAVVIHLEEKLH